MYLNEEEYFTILAEELNFTRAAQRACISQPAMSKAVAKLEQEYGVVLIQRDGKKVSLTSAGKVYLASAQKMLQLREETYRKICPALNQTQPRLRIGINRQYTQQRFAELLRRSYRDYPGPLPDVYEMDSKEALSMLRSGLLDIAIALRMEPVNEGLTQIPLACEELVVFVPDAEDYHALTSQYAIGQAIPPEALRGLNVIQTRKGSMLDSIVLRFYAENDITPRFVCDVGDTQTALSMASRNFGIAFNYLSRRPMYPGEHYYRLQDAPLLRHYLFLQPGTEENEQITFLIRMLQGGAL